MTFCRGKSTESLTHTKPQPNAAKLPRTVEKTKIMCIV